MSALFDYNNQLLAAGYWLLAVNCSPLAAHYSLDGARKIVHGEFSVSGCGN